MAPTAKDSTRIAAACMPRVWPTPGRCRAPTAHSTKTRPSRTCKTFGKVSWRRSLSSERPQAPPGALVGGDDRLHVGGQTSDDVLEPARMAAERAVRVLLLPAEAADLRGPRRRRAEGTLDPCQRGCRRRRIARDRDVFGRVDRLGFAP